MLRWQMAGGQGDVNEFLPWGKRSQGKDPDDIAAWFRAQERKTFGDR